VISAFLSALVFTETLGAYVLLYNVYYRHVDIHMLFRGNVPSYSILCPYVASFCYFWFMTFEKHETEIMIVIENGLYHCCPVNSTTQAFRKKETIEGF
jgi:hypothetical protein